MRRVIASVALLAAGGVILAGCGTEIQERTVTVDGKVVKCLVADNNNSRYSGSGLSCDWANATDAPLVPNDKHLDWMRR